MKLYIPVRKDTIVLKRGIGKNVALEYLRAVSTMAMQLKRRYRMAVEKYILIELKC